MPHPAPRRRRSDRADLRTAGASIAALLVVGACLLSLPKMLAYDVKLAAEEPAKPHFPVTVDPVNETIVEDPAVDALFGETDPALEAAAGLAGDALTWLANLVAR